MVIGCGEGMDMMDPVISDPAEEPAEPITTVGDEKREPEEPTEEEPTKTPEEPVEVPDEPTEEPVDTEPGEPVSTVTLPPGYELPPELIPATPPTLSSNEEDLLEADEGVRHSVPDYDPTEPKPQTAAGYTADLISLLPYEEREEVYELLVDSIALPSFAKVAEKMKEINIRLRMLAGEANKTGNWDPYFDYDEKVSIERGFLGQEDMNILNEIYFEEQPQDRLYEKGKSNYWIILEYYRLQLENPNLPTLVTIGPIKEIGEGLEILRLFRQSCRKGYIFGLDNPWR